MGHARRRVALVAVLVPALVAGAALTAFSAERADAGAVPGADVRNALSAAAGTPRTDEQPHEHDSDDFQNSFVEAAHLATEADAARAANPTLPTGFSDQKVITGVSEAVGADFAPNGTAFIALKTGQIKVATYNSATGAFGAPSDFGDLQTQVHNFHDRGLTGIAVDPQFPTRPYVYVNYTYDKDPRDGVNGAVPKWGKGTAYDSCAAPADESTPNVAGCVAQDRVSRLTASQASGSWKMTAEKELLVGGCYQFGSHASGDVTFGPDGKLYASSGEGASFNTQDYGQYGGNPCADPANEGGSLRAQDYRSASDPALTVDGSVFRLDPDNGIVPTQANAAQWLVAYGQRNPWRLAFRPKADGSGLSNELWSADVGASKAEEVNRIADVTSVTTPINRGWPCYEGNLTASAVQPAWDALNLSLCETLYSQGPGAVEKPYFSYQTRDGGPLVAGEDCANETSSVSGIAFPTAQSNYPAAYKNAMFFSDFARSCIWSLAKKSDGEPDPTKILTFLQSASTPVDLLTGPGGDLYYVDYGISEEGGVIPGGAGVHRIVYTGSNGTPTARITADKLSGAAPLQVSFSGATSTDPDGDALTYRWDFDNNGTWDATGVTASRSYAAGTYTAKLEVNDGQGHIHTTTVQVQAGNTAPTLGTVTPTTALTWAVGDTISYSAAATDPQETLPSSAFSWQLEIRHCPSGVCHSHPFGTFSGPTGSFNAPSHEYPSHLLLTVTVTDSGGLTDSRTVQLNPKTADVTFASSPSGAGVTVGETARTAPYTETFIQKSPFTVSAAPTTGTGASIAAFSAWSDGGARSHTVAPGTSSSTLTATYTRPTAGLTANPTSGNAPLDVTYTASGTNASGVTGGFTYAWDTDNDGQYDDGTGVTRTATYTAAGSPVVKVLVTDSRGATDAKSVTVTVAAAANRNPVAAVSANPTSGSAPLAVSFSASGSTDPDGDPLTYAWDLDNDGQYDDATGITATSSFSAVGARTVTVQVADGRGGTGTKAVTVTVTNTAPTARIVTNPSPASGQAPLAVTFDGRSSSDPNEASSSTLTYAWDLDGNGSYETSGATPSKSFGVGSTTVGLRVTDPQGLSSTTSVPVTASNTAPSITSMTPAAGTTWSVGQVVGLSASATDPQETLPDSAYTWKVERQDCESGCQRSTVATVTGRTGSFTVPQMPYPSYLFVSLTVKDSQNQTTAQTRQLSPKTAALTFATTPAGGTVTVAGTDRTTPYSQTFVQGGSVTISAPATRVVSGANHGFSTWSDGGARSHTIAAPTAATTYTATYLRQNRGPTAAILTNPPTASGPAPLTVSFDGSGSLDPDGESLTYAWDLDGDGAYDDGTGATATRTFPVGTVTVGLQVTDGNAGTDTAVATVTSQNTAPVVGAVSAYPDTTFQVGQTLGFDAAATDAQETLPDSAYTFVLERQDCESGCPRQVVRSWPGVRVGQLAVPDLPYPSHLYLTATVTDSQGLTGTRTLRLDPRPTALTVTTKGKLKVGVDGTDRKSGWTGQYVVGGTASLVAPKQQVRNGVRYVFVKWSDGGARRHDVRVWEQPLTVKAIYRKVR